MVEPVAASPAAVARIGHALFVLTLGVYVFTAGGSLTTTDAVATFDVTRNIVEHGSVAMSGNLLGMQAHRGRDGRYYAPFGLGQSIYNVPFYLAAKAFVGLTGVRIGRSDSIAKAFVALGQTLLGAAVVWELFRFGVTLTGSPWAAAWAAITLAFGSILWPYARFGFNQPLATFTLLCATHRVFLGARAGDTRRLVSCGIWLAASLLTRHEMGLAVVPIAVWLLFDGRRPFAERCRHLAALAPGVAAGVASLLVYNAVRFGNPLDSGYLRDPVPGFGSPILGGMLALLFSPSASLFLYSPVALAGVAGLAWLFMKRDRSAALLLVSLILLFLAFYATLGNWLGGRSYGSRYLVVVLPFLGLGWAAALQALPGSIRPRALAVVLAVGILVQLPGVLIDYAKASQSAAASQGRFTTEARQWEWRASPLVLNARALVHALPENIDYVLGRRPVPAIQPPSGEADRGFSQQFSFSLDLWWLYLFYLHAVPRSVVLVLVLSFAVFVGVCSRRLARVLPSGAR
jgi:hypothetical protein